MDIILFAKRGKKPARLHLSLWTITALPALLLCLVAGVMVVAGYHFGKSDGQRQLLAGKWATELQRHDEEIAQALTSAHDNVDALTQRMGQLQAQVMRLNALGQRLVETAHLDQGEFAFDDPPGLGGPASEASALHPVKIPDFIAALEHLAAQLDDKEQQLHLMESLYMNRDMQRDTRPSGRPIAKGWISSYFGERTDPFSGLQEYHKGMDFAGKAGSDVVAVAAGVVTWSGDRYGYGKMVEVNHGNGYATRYAHNKEILVKTGELVKKGQRLALMGTSGRSTGPHVHFEVLYKGRAVNPSKYVFALRTSR